MINTVAVKQKPTQKILKWSVLSLVVIGMGAASFAFATKNSAQATPKPVASIDLQRYAGQWYEIAHLPMFFQRKCASDTVATYTVQQNGKVGVLNQCRTKTGEVIQSRGEASASKASNSQLKVSFLPKGLRWLPFTKGDYWVLKLDNDYQTVLVGGPSHKYLWVLSRKPSIDDAVLTEYLEEAKRQGYDLSNLVNTPHSQAITTH